MFDTLDSDSLSNILSFLDTYQCMNLALTNRFLYDKLYDRKKVEEISFQIKHDVEKKRKNHILIKRLENDCVRKGSCEDCHKTGLLYNSFRSPLKKKWVCIERCVFKCLQCESLLYSQNVDGMHEPVMCHKCHKRFSFRLGQ